MNPEAKHKNNPPGATATAMILQRGENYFSRGLMTFYLFVLFAAAVSAPFAGIISRMVCGLELVPPISATRNANQKFTRAKMPQQFSSRLDATALGAVFHRRQLLQMHHRENLGW